LPQRRKVTKKHKAMNCNKLNFVKSLCFRVLVAVKMKLNTEKLMATLLYQNQK